VDERAVHLLVEIEIEGVERAVGVAKVGVLDPARDEPVLPTDEFVADERRYEIDWRLPFGLGVAQARVAAIPERRSLRRAASSSTRFMWGLLSGGR
jgi:hypothetical protein